MKNWLLNIAGSSALALGVIGIFLPLVPTTPFLLLAAACFVRSSPRMYRWLLDHPWYGPYIHSYREFGAIPRRAKVLGLIVLWVALGSSATLLRRTPLAAAALLTVGLAISAHILRLKTMTPQMRQAARKR